MLAAWCFQGHAGHDRVVLMAAGWKQGRPRLGLFIPSPDPCQQTGPNVYCCKLFAIAPPIRQKAAVVQPYGATYAHALGTVLATAPGPWAHATLKFSLQPVSRFYSGCLL